MRVIFNTSLFKHHSVVAIVDGLLKARCFHDYDRNGDAQHG
jgi:hypothetical protein